MSEPTAVTSRDNPLLVRLRKLARDPAAYRKLGVVWLEGEHLCSAVRDRGHAATHAVLSESAWQQPALRALGEWAAHTVRVPDPLFAGVSGLESPAGIGFLIDTPGAPPLRPDAASVVLDRLQDAGNVGSVLRSASALGFKQVLALAGTAALWSPKVLRAGMGAHFGLRLTEGLREADLDALRVPLVVASPHAPGSLDDAPLPYPCAWVFGHEGKGVSEPLAARCAQALRISQPGGEESLNVAAAAAICLYATSRRRTP